MNANLEKKKELCDKVEALKDSTDWKATAEQLTKLQKEWKTIGPVSKKNSDAIWKRFISACDYFFEQKNKATSSQRSVEVENLEKKRVIIDKLGAIDESIDAQEAEKQMRELMKEVKVKLATPISSFLNFKPLYKQKKPCNKVTELSFIL